APVYGHYHVDNLNDLSDWMTTSLCALDPATGEEEVLYECPGTWLDRQVADGALWRTGEQGKVLCKPLDQPEEFTVLQASLPVYPSAVYTEDTLLSATDGAGKARPSLYDAPPAVWSAAPSAAGWAARTGPSG